MLKVGLTGGIGSGKTTVAKIFSLLGVPVYNADESAKRLMQEDPILRRSIIAHFGEKAYTGGKLDRVWLAEQVFNDKGKLSALNALVHPATIEDALQWMSQQQAPYIIKEAALLFESGSNNGLDLIIGVQAPEALRIERVINRGKTTEMEIRKRIDLQMPEQEKLDRCQEIIQNDGNRMLIPQVVQLHNKLMALASPTHTHA
jgi:dephospho-CoA kinase